MALNKSRIMKFHVLLNQAGLRDNKADILAGYGVESTLDLSVEQLEELIARLVQIVGDKKSVKAAATRKKRSTILGLLDQLGIRANNGNWKRVNAYLMNPRIAGKMMFEMTDEELDMLALKLRAIIRKENQKVEEDSFLARNN